MNANIERICKDKANGYGLKFWNYIEIIALILVTVSPLLPQIFKFCIVLFLILINIKKIKKINGLQLIILLLLLSFFTLGFTKDLFESRTILDFSVLNIYYPACMILGCLIAIKYGRDVFLYAIEKIVYVTAVISILSYFTYSLYPDMLNYLISYNYYETTHKTGILFNVLIGEDYIVLRNTGIASEPGLYQLILNIALCIHLKNTASISIRKLLVYSIAVITTASTAGLIAFAFIIFRILFSNIKIALLTLLFILIFSSVLYDQILYQFQYKLFGSYAFETRYEPFKNTIEIAKDNILGLGNTGYNYYFDGFVQPSFDSYTQIFIRYGYGMLLLILFLLFYIGTRDKIISLILLITFTSQGIWFAPLVAIFYFIYLDNNGLTNANKSM